MFAVNYIYLFISTVVFDCYMMLSTTR